MKTKLTLALVALITSSAFAAIPAVLPEFKNEKQLAEWREEMAAKHAATTTASDNHAFYTGKPYIESSGSYAFKYRSYNPELARWTSEDPSGFPDGANGSIYAPTPTYGIDYAGLWRILILSSTDNQETLITQSGNISASATINAVGNDPVPIEGTNQFSGYTTISLSGYANAVNFRLNNPDGDLTVSSSANPLMATLRISNTGTFLHDSQGGSTLENNGYFRLGVGMSIRVDPNNPSYAYAMTTASAAYAGTGLTGFGISLGPVGVSASWAGSTGSQRPVQTSELRFQIVE